MRWKSLIQSILVLAVTLPGCRRPDPSASATETGPSLEIAIDFPQRRVTKAGKELAATEDENKIHSLFIWVFRSEGHEPVGEPLILENESDFPPEGGIGRYRFTVDWNFVNTHPDVDIFVLANAASIGSTLGANSTYEELVNADFGYVDDTHDLFGTHAYTTEVDAQKGLPMSAMKTHAKVLGSAPRMKVDAVSLVRAVSRLRIVLCRTRTDEGPVDEVSVEGITFYKDQIPLRENVFTESSYSIGAEYTPDAFSFAGPSEIKEHPVPEDLVYINQDPDAYQALLDQAALDGTVNDLGYVYLRESDLRLAGRVNYTINGNTRFREFAMAAKGDFARNHTWTLFAYFMSGRNLQVSLVATPWDRGDYQVDFLDQAVTVTKKFKVDERTCEIIPDDPDNPDGFIDVKLIPGVAAKGTLTVTTPVGGTLMITPLGAAALFDVTPQASIGREITIEIRNNPETQIDISQLPESETTLTLSFSVLVNGREVNADSEIIDDLYRFHL